MAHAMCGLFLFHCARGRAARAMAGLGASCGWARLKWRLRARSPRLAAGCAGFRLWGFARPPLRLSHVGCVCGVCAFLQILRPPQAGRGGELEAPSPGQRVLGGEECEGLAGLHQGVNGYLRGCSQAPALPCISWLFSVPKKN